MAQSTSRFPCPAPAIDALLHDPRPEMQKKVGPTSTCIHVLYMYTLHTVYIYDIWYI